MINLIIDQGNTSAKVALYEQEKEVYAIEAKTDLLDTLSSLFGEYPVDKAIYSSVAGKDDKITLFIEQHVKKVLFLSRDTPLPIQVLYKTPETLGYDRLAGVVGANFLQPDVPCLVIDAGTAITYDFIDAGGIYYGGNISPGLQMRFKALHVYTAKLPLIDKEGDLPYLGDSTETAIRSGVVTGMIHEIDGYISELKEKYPNLFVFLTGGDTFFLAERLKNSIFADTKLLIKGLNRILNYNADL